MTVLKTITKWLITITLPFMLIMLSIRILFTPLFLNIEYNLPGFPADTYGFTTAERLSWGKSTMEYLFNNKGPEFLDTLRFDEYKSIYNPRETSHLVDVKNLLQTALTVFYALIGLYLVHNRYFLLAQMDEDNLAGVVQWWLVNNRLNCIYFIFHGNKF